MTFVVASAGIDLSSGAVVALSGVVMALSLREGWGVGVTIGLGLGTGALIGLANALLVVRARITPFMATLTTMNLIAGATLILTQSIPIYGFSARFAWLGRGSVAGVPVSAAAAAAFTVIGALARRARFVPAAGGILYSSRVVIATARGRNGSVGPTRGAQGTTRPEGT